MLDCASERALSDAIPIRGPSHGKSSSSRNVAFRRFSLTLHSESCVARSIVNRLQDDVVVTLVSAIAARCFRAVAKRVRPDNETATTFANHIPVREPVIAFRFSARRDKQPTKLHSCNVREFTHIRPPAIGHQS
jgi:hypothetical protein